MGDTRIQWLAGPMLAGALSALVFLAPAAGSALGAVLQMATPLPLYYIALQKGALGAMAGLTSGFALVALVAPPLSSLAVYIGIFGLPLLVGAWLYEAAGTSLREAALGRIVAGMAMALALVMLTGALLFDRAFADQGGILGASRNMAQSVAEAILPQDATPEQAAQHREAFAQIAPMIPLAVAAGYFVLHVLNALAGFGLQKNREGAPRPIWSSLWLPRWLVVPALGVTALAFVGGESGIFAGIAAAVLGVPLVLQGLAVLHVKSRNRPLRPFLLTGAYILVFLADGARLVAAALGAADHWLDFRKQAAPPRGKENE
ncbi:MAG: hypothetical protein Tsb0016_18050 [Sphingomonadales bacterium]